MTNRLHPIIAEKNDICHFYVLSILWELPYMWGEQEIEEQEDPKLKEQLNIEMEVEKLEQVDEYGAYQRSKGEILLNPPC